MIDLHNLGIILREITGVDTSKYISTQRQNLEL